MEITPIRRSSLKQVRNSERSSLERPNSKRISNPFITVHFHIGDHEDEGRIRVVPEAKPSDISNPAQEPNGTVEKEKVNQNDSNSNFKESIIPKIVSVLIGLTLISAVGLIVLSVFVILSINKQEKVAKDATLISSTVLGILIGLLVEMLFNCVAVSVLMSISEKGEKEK